MIQVIYQNGQTGDAFDISSICTKCTITSKRRSTPSTLKLECLNSKGISFVNGGVLQVRDGSRGLFHGYIFTIEKKSGVLSRETQLADYLQNTQTPNSENGYISITAYDQLRYLKNKETYVFKQKRADEIIASIANDFELKIGTLANSGYIIPLMLEDNQELFNIIEKAIDLTIVNTGKAWRFFDNFGTLEFTELKSNLTDIVIGESSLAQSYTASESIDKDYYNQVKLVRDVAKDSNAPRKVFLQKDSEAQRRYGVLQYYDVVNANASLTQVEKSSQELLSLYNQPKKTISLKCLIDTRVRAGIGVYVHLQDIGANGYYIIEECSLDLLAQEMQLKLYIA